MFKKEDSYLPASISSSSPLPLTNLFRPMQSRCAAGFEEQQREIRIWTMHQRSIFRHMHSGPQLIVYRRRKHSVTIITYNLPSILI